MFVFGINIPLVEILLIILVILIGFLIMMLLEFRDLRRTILIEQYDVQHLEKGLQSLGILKPEASQKAEQYVRGAISSGYSPHHIRHALLRQNWPRHIVDSLFKKIFGK